MTPHEYHVKFERLFTLSKELRQGLNSLQSELLAEIMDAAASRLVKRAPCACSKVWGSYSILSTEDGVLVVEGDPEEIP